MPTRNMLYAREYVINDSIKINIPTVDEVLNDEDNYNSIVATVTATPYTMMVQLDDIGIDFSEIDEYDLFLLTSSSLAHMDTRIVFGDLDFSKFQVMRNTQNNTIVLYDAENDIVIDRSIYVQICDAIRKVNNLKKENKKPGNTEAKKYMIQRARKKMQRNRKKVVDSQLEQLIVALVNTKEFSYTYETVRDVTIYQFYESLHQIMWKVDYDNRMIGIYTGNISAKDIGQDYLSWLTRKK